MAYDEKLAERVRKALGGLPKIEEKKMMGGLRKRSRLNEKGVYERYYFQNSKDKMRMADLRSASYLISR